MHSKKNFIAKPIHLVSINSFGKLVLHYQGVEYLRSLKSPIAVLSIAGPYRTGKSYLLNSLITPPSEPQAIQTNNPSFQVGHTTNQTTHGLWIWSRSILAEDQNNQIANVIVMDSEGYASTQSTHDKRLITLALLLSSCFLFNSKGAIDKDSIFDLQFVIEVARLINRNQQINNLEENTKSSCDFHWVLRDFHLELVNQLGSKITPNQYMENCFLQASSKVNQKTIQTLKDYFPQRSCHTLCQPNLDSASEQRPEFISQLLSLKQKIFKQKIKSFNMGGQAFVSIIKSYVQAMNNGQKMDQVFQEGYDCRVRLDCMEKLNSKLKKLQGQKSPQLPSKLSTIKSEIKHYYKQRMCSHKQIKVLDNDVEQIINQYQQQHSSKHLVSVRCVDKESQHKRLLSVPRMGGVRLSIHCEESIQRSFLDDQDDGKGIRGSKILQRRSVEKQKIAPQMKLLTSKIQDLQLKLHRTELHLSTAESEITQLRYENQHLKHMLTSKQDEIIERLDDRSKQQQKSSQKIQHLNQQNKDLQKSKRLLQSQIQKLTLLYQQKIDYLQRQLFQSDQVRIKQYQQQKNRYKQKVHQLSEQIQQIKLKHEQQAKYLREMFTRNEQQKMKTYKYLKSSQDQGKTIYQELEDAGKLIQQLKSQIQRLSIESQKGKQQFMNVCLKLGQKQNQVKQEKLQHEKRLEQTQTNLRSLYKSKLQSKDEIIENLEHKIKMLQMQIQSENSNLISRLEQLQTNHSQQKQDLFNLNNELRNGCLQALQRVSLLREQLDEKDKQYNSLEQQKKHLNSQIQQQRKQQQKIYQKHKEQTKNLKRYYQEQIYKQEQKITQLNHSLKQKQSAISQLLHKIGCVRIQLQNQQGKIQQLEEQKNQLKQDIKDRDREIQNLTYQLSSAQKKIYQQNINAQDLAIQSKRELSNVSSALQQANIQKQQLIQSLSTLNSQLSNQYEHLQTLFNEKYQHEKRKYEQMLKQMIDFQRKKMSDSQKQIRQTVKAEEKVKYLQKELIEVKNDKEKLQKQLLERKTQLTQVTQQFSQVKRQNSKQMALITQKLMFNQQQLQQSRSQIQVKCKQIEQIEQKFSVNQQKTVQQINELNHIIKLHQDLINQSNKTSQAMKEEISLNKQNFSNQLAALTTEILELNKKLSFQKADKQIMQANILQLTQKLLTQQKKMQNYCRLYKDKLTKLKVGKQMLQEQLSKVKQQLTKSKNLLRQKQDMYQKDFQLWLKKFQTLQSYLKQTNHSIYQKQNIKLIVQLSNQLLKKQLSKEKVYPEISKQQSFNKFKIINNQSKLNTRQTFNKNQQIKHNLQYMTMTG